MNTILYIFSVVFFFNIRSEYLEPSNSTKEIPGGKPYGFQQTISTPRTCCPCNITLLKPISEVRRNYTPPTENTVYRLPDSIWPSEYKLSLKLDFNELKKPNERMKVVGNLSIFVTFKNETDKIILNLYDLLIIHSITVRNLEMGQEKLNLTKSAHILNSSNLQINLSLNVSIGTNCVIEFLYFESIHYFNQESGIISRKYQNSKGKFGYMLATQFQPESARSVFPCFDEPRFKAKFQLNVTTNYEYKILSNMPEDSCLKSIGKNSSIWKTCSFQMSPKMPVYNLAFAIVDFDYIQKKDSKGRVFRIWARKSEISKTYFALDITIQAIQLLEKKLGIKFPLEKIDSLAIPNLKGFLGMEHYGLITYDEPVIVWNEKFPLTFSKMLCVLIICHEVAHQWFGNLVTMTYWKDLWLNEGFATFYSYKIAKEILKDETYYSLEHLSVINYVRYFDDYYSTSRSTISAPIGLFVESKFDYLSYKKGFIIVHMIEKILGTDRFDLGITDYLTENQYESVSPKVLWKSLNKFFKYPIENIMQDWLNNICYPVVQISLHENESISLKQNTSINCKSRISKSIYQRSMLDEWAIPLYIVFGNGTFQSKYIFDKLKNSSTTINIESFNGSTDWIIINRDYNSFFCTDYDTNIFDRVTQQMLKNHLLIPPINRAQIMQDYYDLSKKFQRNNLKGLFKLFLYLEKESDPIPLSTAISLLDRLSGLFEYRTFYPVWNKYVAKILKTALDKLVGDFRNDFYNRKATYLTLRRNLLNIACRLNLEQCYKISDKILKRWKENKLKKTDYDLLHIVLCKYIDLDSSGENWQSMYKNSEFQSWDYINVKYYAMGCSKVPWIIEKNIDVAYHVLKNISSENLFLHVSPIFFDNVPPDYLLGLTSLSTLLLLSSIYNTPNSINYLIRLDKDCLKLIYVSLLYPAHFPFPNSIVEHAIPTLSHFNIINYLLRGKDNSKNHVLEDAKTNLNWILSNYNLEKQLRDIML